MKIPKEIDALLLRRAAARKTKDWKQSDELRKEIEGAGFTLKDTAKGQVIEGE